MRTTKYRAWDKIEKTMRLVKSIRYADDGFAGTVTVELVGGREPYYVNGESCELLQWTGLVDRNGKEIYEDDLVVVETRTEKWPPRRVVWASDTCEFCLEDLDGGLLYDMYVPDVEPYEVVGHIYDDLGIFTDHPCDTCGNHERVSKWLVERNKNMEVGFICPECFLRNNKAIEVEVPYGD